MYYLYTIQRLKWWDVYDVCTRSISERVSLTGHKITFTFRFLLLRFYLEVKLYGDVCNAWHTLSYSIFFSLILTDKSHLIPLHSTCVCVCVCMFVHLSIYMYLNVCTSLVDVELWIWLFSFIHSFIASVLPLSLERTNGSHKYHDCHLPITKKGTEKERKKKHININIISISTSV